MLAATVAAAIIWYRCHVQPRAKAYGRIVISVAFVVLICFSVASAVLGSQASPDAAERSPGVRFDGLSHSRVEDHEQPDSINQVITNHAGVAATR
jgi:hypothetical protein